MNWIKQIIPKLVAAGAPIDAVGFQAHGLKGTSAATLQSRLDDIYKSIQLPMFITEYDIGDNNDQSQLDNYKAHITVMWNHPKVVGITVWGYILGSTWVEGTGIIRNGQERPAMTWLKEFIKANPNPPNDYPNLTAGSGSSSFRLTVNTNGLGDVVCDPKDNRFEKDTKVSVTAKAQDGWVFDGWSGDASGNQNPLQVTMDAAKEITANFKTVDGKEDLLSDGSFSSDNGSWGFNNWSGTGSGTIENGEYKITVSEVAENYYDIQAVQPGILLEEGKSYRLAFEARSSANRTLNVNVGMPDEPYTSFLSDIVNGKNVVELTTAKQKFTLDFVMKDPTFENSRVEFSAGLDKATVYIDNVSLYEIESNQVLPSRAKQNNNQIAVQQCGAFVKITFDAKDNSNLSVDIHDLKGKIVKSVRLNKQPGVAQSFSINTNGMSKGYYIVKVKTGNSVRKSGFVFSGR
ncbi:MAG: carbohydrate binding domain-containing protein [Fibrobacter sp.]|nr:carbohydrate binding domain-containing protein [Fibrobacter sp.]